MLWLFVVVLIALWLLGLFLKLLGFFIYLFLVAAIVLVAWRFVTNRGRIR